MSGSHRDGDARTCGAATVVAGQSTVFVNGVLWSVEGDPNDHGGGELIHSGSTVFINGILVIILGDSAAPDALCPILDGPHCAPAAASASTNVFAYG